MDKATQTAIGNAQSIIKTTLDLAGMSPLFSALLTLDGLTETQKIRIATAAQLFTLSKAELLRAVYPNESKSTKEQQ